MLSRRLFELAKARPGSDVFVHVDQRWTYGSAAKYVVRAAHELGFEQLDRIFLFCRDRPEALLLLAAANQAGVECGILNRAQGLDSALSLLSRVGGGSLLLDEDVHGLDDRTMRIPSAQTLGVAPDKEDLPEDIPDGPGEGGDLLTFTSGTTGTPKAVRHSWRRLLDQNRGYSVAKARRWLLAYPLNHFGCIQMLAHALKTASPLVIPRQPGVASAFEAMEAHDVEAISSTPTFWRMMFASIPEAALKTLNLKQITLGGEAATSDVLRSLVQLYPEANVSHVYAATEVGSCFSVSDGKPGFPAEYLRRAVGGVRLRVQDGELLVRPQKPMKEYASGEKEPVTEDGWYRTGDLVEVTDDRVYFLGRRGDMINVGGRKVAPYRVEEVINAHSAVTASRVRGESNPVTGQLVFAEIELTPDVSPSEKLERKIRAHCSAKLNTYEVPRIIEFVDSIERINQKVARLQDASDSNS